MNVSEKIQYRFGIFRVNRKFPGHLWHLRIGFMKPTELSFVLQPALSDAWDRGAVQQHLGFVWKQLTDFLTASPFNSDERSTIVCS